MKSLLIIALWATIPNLTYAQKAVPEKPNKVAEKPSVKKGKTKTAITPAVSFKPDNMILEVAPGTTLNEKILVQNNEDVEYKAQVVVVPMYMNDSGVLLREEQLKDKKGKTIKASQLPFLKDTIIPEKIVTLKPKQVTTVPLSFKIPADAKGSFYFQYSVQPLNTEYQKIRQAKIAKRKKEVKGASMMVAVNVYSVGAISVKDKSQVDVQAKTQIKYLKPTKQVLVQTQLTNKGNDFARQYEGIGVISKGGKVVAKFDIKGVQKLTMLTPNSTQMFAGSVEAQLDKGDYDVVMTFKDFKGQKISTFKEVLKVN
jgi:hypothetical protein